MSLTRRQLAALIAAAPGFSATKSARKIDITRTSAFTDEIAYDDAAGIAPSAYNKPAQQLISSREAIGARPAF